MIKKIHQKKIAVINDLSGYGRCSLTVAIPIISALKVQCCPVPTSILSNHTGFPVSFFDDYTDKMIPYLEKWKELNLSFDGILSGFLGSEAQIQIVIDMINDFAKEETLVIIDPIMGDHGIPYKTYTPGMCKRMGELVRYGDIIIPNLTESCILTGRTYKESGWSQSELKDMVEELCAMGPSAVIITGVKEGDVLTNVIGEKGKTPVFLTSERVGNDRPGTGDIFSSIVAAEAVKGGSLVSAVRKAADFVKKSILVSEEFNIPVKEGVCFEEILSDLIL